MWCVSTPSLFYLLPFATVRCKRDRRTDLSVGLESERKRERYNRCPHTRHTEIRRNMQKHMVHSIHILVSASHTNAERHARLPTHAYTTHIPLQMYTHILAWFNIQENMHIYVRFAHSLSHTQSLTPLASPFGDHLDSILSIATMRALL